MIGAAADHDVVMEDDPEMIRGGCLVSAGDGEVDARLDAQMSRIVQGLFPELLETPEVPSHPTPAPVAPAPSPVVADPPSEPAPGSSEAPAPDSVVDSWDEIAPETNPAPPAVESDEDEPR